MSLDFEIDGRNFRAEKLDAFGQLHLSRKLAPLLPPLAPVILKLETEFKKAEGKEAKPLTAADILSLAELSEPFTEALANMEDKDIEKIFLLTLTSVKVQTDVAQNVWVPLWIVGSRQAASMEFNDLGALFPVVMRVIIFNLGNFIDGLLTRRAAGSPGLNGAVSPAKTIG